MSQASWIDALHDRLPSTDGKILVWNPEIGVVACKHDYGEWVDVMDKVTVEFRYWMPAPEGPFYSELKVLPTDKLV